MKTWITAALLAVCAVCAALGWHWCTGEAVYRIPKGEQPPELFDIPPAKKPPTKKPLQ